MRVWAFPSVYPYDYEGKTWAGIFAHRQYKQLVALGAEVNVVVPVPWHPPFPFSLAHKDWKDAARFGYPYKRVYDGITVYHPRIENIRPSRFMKKTHGERVIDAIMGIFRDNKIKLDPKNDIFFSQWIPESVLVQEAAHRLGIKSGILGIGDDIIIFPHSSEANFNVFKKTLVEADLRVTNAKYLSREANKTIGMSLPFETVYFEIDFDVFKPPTDEQRAALRKQYKVPDGKVAILTIGSPIIRKGWIDLFDALKKVKETNNNFVLLAVHSGGSEFDFDEETRSRGLSANIIDIGEVAPPAIPSMYNLADLFCLPSHWEGLATVVIEAMASGLPVITTDICGHPEIIESGVNGVLIPMKRPDIIASELLSLINDKEKRERFGSKARAFVTEENGEFANNTAKLYKVLQRTLNEPPGVK